MTIIQYQGRQARREGSEQRRKAILDAALAIIVRDGIRNVRHRAVAKEAEVPLSATTYYFKDITDLILDCFTLFAEQAMEIVIRPLNDTLEEIIQDEMTQASLRPEQIPVVVEKISIALADYMVNTVASSRDHLIAEQAFLQEAVLDARLRPLAVAYMNRNIEMVVPFCEVIGMESPLHAASIIWSAFIQLELRLLVDDSIGRDDILKQIQTLITAFVKI